MGGLGIRGLLSRLARERRGASAVEFALLAPLLLLMLAVLIDGSQYIQQTMQVRAAAQAGADYAQRNSYDPTAVQNAVLNAAPLATSGPTALSVAAPVQTRGCIANGQIVASGGSSCAAGGPPGFFVTVRAQKPFAPLMTWGGLVGGTINAQSTVRIQ